MKQQIFKKVLAASVSVTLAFAPLVSYACTSFLLKGSDGGYVYGRTMEFGLPLNSQLTTIPRAYAHKGIGIDGKYGSGLNWSAKYAVAGMNALGLPELVDGMNEKGLIGGVLNFPNSAAYPAVTQAESSSSINSVQVLTYVLTNFATVDEVKAGLPKIKVNGAKLAVYGNQTPPVHYTLHDSNGKSIVVEYSKNGLSIMDNPTTVLTNDPPFQDHLNSIGNYSNLSKVEKPPLVINGATYAAPSSGNGLHGLPGDFLSPSRFIRALFLSNSVPTNFTNAQMDGAAWHILGSFDIPPGSVTLPASNPYGGGTGGYEVTEWTIVANNKTMVYNVKMFENNNTYAFDLKKMDVNAKEINYVKLAQPKILVPVN
ncbi:choloylglycine hydrolase family protein [Polynucleobacter sp. JS-JIR-II-c23]|uniref:choloylglycine hydrolase family protein n=1 Tax=Polynucleobacter sp. JS-JIR-II-c23 TaxID=1758393 RepID=UPI002B222D45|nr:choloylglycine hydrolase family protein [Polynucleobacter sp. JS-JIR-II-c23]MEA9603379.1 choloylglycine hydrolase family protein [Polynucleobacter sp. JS-JIR-II-c23]